ncbi:mechanosensitive ion channel protein 8 isoform X2 [Jatropha curcas]|uniref:mechanosensitive ion channel protein 8 isoform X2 n=1 Tax=Jatropha curcas TaxID=180498 RepID=UPI0009D6477A|nr:mechanosensitive ion channel protein 8 isoform X2 [Jatropha curcas]
MDYSPLKKSFKAHSSYKHARKTSEGGNGGSTSNNDHEELPILSRHRSHRSVDTQRPTPVILVPDHDEVIVKVDGSSSSGCSSSGKPRREPSFGFVQGVEDPPSKLINQFLNKQKNAGGEISLDIDMDMDEIRRELHDRNLPPFPESPKNTPSREIRVSFSPSLSNLDSPIESVRRRYKDLQENNNKDDPAMQSQQQQQRLEEVLHCTSNKSFRTQTSRLSRLKTKSRLIDPPPDEIGMVSVRFPPKSGQLKSGIIGGGGGGGGDDDEEDPLEDEDLPEEYKRAHLSIITVLQWLSLIAIIAALFCSLCIDRLKEVSFLELKLWKWEVLLLVLICGRLVSGWGIRIIVFFIERNFLLRKRVLYFVYGLKDGVQNCWWLGLVLLAWHFLFDQKVERETKGDLLQYVTKILVCFLVANFIWLLKTLMVKVLASSFHVSTYFDRIQESLFNQYVIETLSGPPLIEIQRNEEEIEKTAAEVRKLQNAGATMPPELRAAVFSSPIRVTASDQGTQKSFRGMKSFKFSGQLSKKGEKKTDNGITIDRLHRLNHKNVSAWNMKRLMNIVRYGSLATLDEQILGSTDAGDESATAIKSENEAKAAARKIFLNVACQGSKYIYEEDLMRFMQEDEVLKTMNFFEGASERRRISKSSLKNWVVNAFRERRALALTLNDTKTAVNKLHQVVNMCEVDGLQLVVEEMNILTTVFLRADNLKVVYHNNILATKSIGNYYRSPDMGDAIEFYVHISTPAEKLALMKQRLISYIEGKKEHWYPNPMVVLKELDGLNKVKVALWLNHRMNHQDIGERFERRSSLMEEMIKIFQELDIQYRLYPLDINIQSMPPFPS